MTLDPTTRAVLEVIHPQGYVVDVAYVNGHVVTATSETGELAGEAAQAPAGTVVLEG